MTIAEPIAAAWQRHGDDPEGVADVLVSLAESAESSEVPALLGLAVHVCCEHLRCEDRVLEVLGIAERRGLAAESEACASAMTRTRTLLRLVATGEEAALAGVADLGRERASAEVRVLAGAAGVRAARGDVVLAGRWLARAASSSWGLAPTDPALKALASQANNLASLLEERVDRTPEVDQVLRSAAQLAFAAWERAGSWVEVERAEYRLAKAHLALGEPSPALTHALVCEAICRHHGAAPDELAYAVVLVLEVLERMDDPVRIAAQRSVLSDLRQANPELVVPG